MRILGFLITRLKGVRVGDLESAIIDLQERVDIIERHRVLKVKEAKLEEAKQSEIDEVLNAGQVPAGKADLWSGL